MSSGSAFASTTDSTGGVSSVMGSGRRPPTNRFAPCSPITTAAGWAKAPTRGTGSGPPPTSWNSRRSAFSRSTPRRRGGWPWPAAATSAGACRRTPPSAAAGTPIGWTSPGSGSGPTPPGCRRPPRGVQRCKLRPGARHRGCGERRVGARLGSFVGLAGMALTAAVGGPEVGGKLATAIPAQPGEVEAGEREVLGGVVAPELVLGAAVGRPDVETLGGEAAARLVHAEGYADEPARLGRGAGHRRAGDVHLDDGCQPGPVSASGGSSPTSPEVAPRWSCRGAAPRP